MGYIKNKYYIIPIHEHDPLYIDIFIDTHIDTRSSCTSPIG